MGTGEFNTVRGGGGGGCNPVMDMYPIHGGVEIHVLLIIPCYGNQSDGQQDLNTDFIHY